MDIKCVVCGEPWDAYGVENGDMLPWEAKLFKQGSGCPACEGETETPFNPTSIQDFENGDQDEIERLNAYDDHKKGLTPKWVQPKPKVFWTCEGCGVEVKEDLESYEKDAIEYHLPLKAKGRQWYHSHPYHRGTPEKAPHTMIGDSPICEFCVSHCVDCSAEITSLLDFGDVYDEGQAFDSGDYMGSVICIDCLEKRPHDDD